ncbi:MAG: TOBE domain-containing protein [Gammaproteobacteria bacterium]|nr:TOBE domain-containing protein [Gammaproteobacteria bacterium]
MTSKPGKLQGQIWLAAESSSNSFAIEQVRLLEAIHESGSISAAARELGISYKTAWERLERMNNLSEAPLVSRSAGGSQGGGSQLTAHGKKILSGFSRLASEHNDFIEKLGSGLNRIDDLASFVASNRLVSSAGNQFLGAVEAVAPGSVNAEVRIKVNERVSLVAIITEQSRAELGIEPGKQVIALVKASSVLLAASAELTVSARNIIPGTIARLATGAVNTDVSLDIGDDKTLNAVITNMSAKRMGIAEGQDITAFFKASSVILLGG